MKLVVITSIAEFEKDVKMLLKEAQVKSYTYKDVKGFGDTSGDEVENNWFGSDLKETESIVFYAFILQQHLDILFDAINAFNKVQTSVSKVHVAVIPVEKYN